MIFYLLAVYVGDQDHSGRIIKIFILTVETHAWQ
jgi:hypothetical protein